MPWSIYLHVAPTRSGFSLQCDDFLAATRRRSSDTSDTSSSSSSEYEAQVVAPNLQQEIVPFFNEEEAAPLLAAPFLIQEDSAPFLKEDCSPSLEHLTAARPRPPHRRPPSGKGRSPRGHQPGGEEEGEEGGEGGVVQATAALSELSDEEIVAEKHFGEEREIFSEQGAGVEEVESGEEDDSLFWSQEMLEGEEQTGHLSGEGVRQRFYRTRVVPGLGLDGEEGRGDTSSLLDSLLSSIDLGRVGGRVEFPELGRDLVTLEESCPWDPVTMVLEAPGPWGDNWQVEGISQFQEQGLAEEARRQRVIPEVVPFLVPQASGQALAVIGGREVDEVSELSEQSGQGSLDFSTSGSSLRQDDTIQVRTVWPLQLAVSSRTSWRKRSRLRSGRRRPRSGRIWSAGHLWCLGRRLSSSWRGPRRARCWPLLPALAPGPTPDHAPGPSSWPLLLAPAPSPCSWRQKYSLPNW